VIEAVRLITVSRRVLTPTMGAVVPLVIEQEIHLPTTKKPAWMVHAGKEKAPPVSRDGGETDIPVVRLCSITHLAVLMQGDIQRPPEGGR
jgi:hypothetical protein